MVRAEVNPSPSHAAGHPPLLAGDFASSGQARANGADAVHPMAAPEVVGVAVAEHVRCHGEAHVHHPPHATKPLHWTHWRKARPWFGPSFRTVLERVAVPPHFLQAGPVCTVPHDCAGA